MQNPPNPHYNKNYYNKYQNNNSENSEQRENFEGPPYQNHYYKHNNPNNYSKPKRYNPDYNKYQPNFQSNRSNNQEERQYYDPQNNSNQSQWQRDKYQNEGPRNMYTEPSNNFGRNNQNPKHKNDRRPDRQLYSARDKHVHGEDSKSEIAITPKNQEEVKFSESSGTLNLENKNQSEPFDGHNNQKRNKKKNQGNQNSGPRDDRDNQGAKEGFNLTATKGRSNEEGNIQNEKTALVDKSPMNKTPERKVLLQIDISTHKSIEKVRIYEDEKDFDALLEKLCKKFDIQGRLGLSFKINVLQSISDVHPDKAMIEGIMQKYIELNFRLVQFEYEASHGHVHLEPHESIRPYLE